ncbi:MAG: DNA polymerase IV [Nitrospirae bacterium]|nr:DNA polymerase IV [Nitrospirota bacterium]
MTLSRVILHIDMNAFFASVEQVANPKLRGKPIVVVGASHRTVITTASYEARAFGVKTGMTVPEAKKACPHVILVIGDNRKYTTASTRIMGIFGRYTPLVEVFSIDEAFLDVTHSCLLFGRGEEIARRIKADIKREVGLTCSVGVAPNKLLAKLASDMQKPDGLTVIPPERVSEVMETLPASELCGIGPGLTASLAALGIKTCGQLGRFSASALRTRFGIIGERLRLMGMGVDDSLVSPSDEEDEAKSVGHSMTLTRDTGDKDELSAHLLHLSEKVGRRMRRNNYLGDTVTLTIRYADFRTFSQSMRFKKPINDGMAIFLSAMKLFTPLRLAMKVRLVGVSVSGLVCDPMQVSLFAEDRKRAAVTEAMDMVNDRYGEFTVTWGTLLSRYNHKDVIAPAWRPTGVKRVEY